MLNIKTTIGDYKISTVELPCLCDTSTFETMIFHDTDTLLNGHYVRTKSTKDAIEQHHIMVEMLAFYTENKLSNARL